MDRPEPSRLRISDDDRHQVAEVLRRAAGEGRLDLEELDERLEATFRAKTYGDLVPITADLPVRTSDVLPAVPQATPPAVGHVGSPVVPAATYTSSVSVLGDCTRRGVWRMPQEHTAFAFLGSVTLDLREAVFEAREVTVNAVSILAGVDVVVNAGTQVVVDGVGVMGDFNQARDKVAAELSPTSPVVRVKGMALLGSVTVRRKEMPGEPRRRRDRPR
jgi:hypothetical protein